VTKKPDSLRIRWEGPVVGISPGVRFALERREVVLQQAGLVKCQSIIVALPNTRSHSSRSWWAAGQ
jgi:hypothetical protein